jgi:hypothetical protein
MSRVSLLCLAVVCVSGVAHAADTKIGEPITIAGLPHLTVFPLTTDTPQADPGYRLLDEAIAAGELVVHEKGKSGQVSELLVSYTGKDPVYAMAGELLLGGKQDRIVAAPTIIPPGSKQFKVSVFCVEHGRWADKGTLKFGSGKRLAHTSLRQMAHKQSQTAVWAEVAKTNAKRGTKNASDTYRSAINDTARNAKVDQAVKAILARTRQTESMVGLLVAVNGEAIAFDRFDSPGLYRKLEPKLVRSYVAEAFDVKAAKSTALSKVGAKAFMDSAKTGKTRVEQRGGGTVTRMDNAAVEGTEVVDAQTPSRKLHRNFYKRKDEPVAPKQRRIQRHRSQRRGSPQPRKGIELQGSPQQRIEN